MRKILAVNGKIRDPPSSQLPIVVREKLGIASAVRLRFRRFPKLTDGEFVTKSELPLSASGYETKITSIFTPKSNCILTLYPKSIV